MDQDKGIRFDWENLSFDLAAMTNSFGSQGQFTVCASGILETFSTDFEPYPNWQIESINLGHFSFFSEVPWITNCVRSALKEKKGVIRISQYEMHAIRISIRDHWGNLIFSAKFDPKYDEVDWIAPCRSSDEEQAISESIKRVLAEAKFEREWKNHVVAKELEAYAHLLSGKITHPKWRDPMLSLLSRKRNS